MQQIGPDQLYPTRFTPPFKVGDMSSQNALEKMVQAATFSDLNHNVRDFRPELSAITESPGLESMYRSAIYGTPRSDTFYSEPNLSILQEDILDLYKGYPPYQLTWVTPQYRPTYSDPVLMNIDDPYHPNYNSPAGTSTAPTSARSTLLNYPYKSPYHPNYNTPTNGSETDVTSQPATVVSSTGIQTIISRGTAPSLPAGSLPSTPGSVSTASLAAPNPSSQSTTPYPTSTASPQVLSTSESTSNPDQSQMDSVQPSYNASTTLSQPSTISNGWQYNRTYVCPCHYAPSMYVCPCKLSSAHAVKYNESNHPSLMACEVCNALESENISELTSANTSLGPALVTSSNNSLNPQIGSCNTSEQGFSANTSLMAASSYNNSTNPASGAQSSNNTSSNPAPGTGNYGSSTTAPSSTTQPSSAAQSTTGPPASLASTSTSNPTANSSPLYSAGSTSVPSGEGALTNTPVDTPSTGKPLGTADSGSFEWDAFPFYNGPGEAPVTPATQRYVLNQWVQPVLAKQQYWV